MMNHRPILFFCGDLHNLGDLALLLQNLETMPAGRKAYVRQWMPLPSEIVVQVEAAGGALVQGRKVHSFVALASRCDIVIGGGQLVRDNVSLASLASQLGAVLAAKARGGRITTRGLGVGSVINRAPRLLWRQLLRSAETVLVRDAASERNAGALVGSNRVRLTADMAFVPSSLHERVAHFDERRELVLVSPCIDDSEGRTIDGPALPALMEKVAAALPDTSIAFVCHDPRPDMDGRAVELLIEKYGPFGQRPAHGYDLSKLLSEYHRAALVITNRLHSIIFALLADRPVLIIDDGNTKTAAAAARFHIPIVSLSGKDDLDAAITRALCHDVQARAAALREVQYASQRNLNQSAS